MAEQKKSNVVSLRLLIDPKANKVLFAEADTDQFVHFMYNLFSLPIATLIKLLSKEGMAVSIQDVCNNIEKLCHAKLDSKIFYQCPNKPSNSSCQSNFSDVRGTTCPRCKAQMRQRSPLLNYVVPNTPMDLTAASGSVSTGGCVTYLVMDDLEVRPMSSVISGIALVNDYNVKNVAALIEKKVQIGVVEVVELLKASLQTKEVLTTVFL